MMKAGLVGLVTALCFTFVSLPVMAQGPAKLRCATVLDNGDAELDWIPETVATGVYSYTLYHASSLAGPYTLLDSITSIAQSSYVHSSAGANNAPQYYFMNVYRLSGKSPPSDTLSTMLLQGSTLDYENISLNWTALHVPFSSYMYPWYLLYREFPPGTWALVDSSQTLAMSYHFWECNENDDTVRFRIGVRDTETGCISFSSRIGEILKNQSNQVPPQIDSVSIDSDGHSIIGWEAAMAPDIVGYTIFRVTSTNDSIGYVDGRFNTFFTDTNSAPCYGPLSYILLSIDYCGNESPFPYDPVTLKDKPQNTIYLDDIQYDPCYMTNKMTWNDYINFTPSICCYKIYVSENGGPFNILVTLPWTTTEYIHNDLNSNTTYSYFVRAYVMDESKSSTSCTREVTTYNSPKPQFMYLRYVTVDNNEQASMLFYTDTTAHVQYYRILRSESPDGPFEQVGNIANNGRDTVSFTDATAEVNSKSYYYQVEVTDSCGFRYVIANSSRTIFLTVDALENYQDVLNWNAYESWDGSVEGYRIYRRTNDSPTLELLDQVGPSVLTYTDNATDLVGSAAKISYLVEAFEGPGNPWGFRETSFSNEVLAEQAARIYVPNALFPRGINNTITPVTVFVDQPGYEFLIYNRWGQLLFQTSDPGQGWDGTYQGKYVDAGIYVYLIRYRNALDQLKVQKGNIAVIY